MSRWQRFKNSRMGYASLWIFMVLFGLSMCAELIANDKPLVVRYEGHFYFPIVKSQPETVFGGDFTGTSAVWELSDDFSSFGSGNINLGIFL